MSGFMGNDPWLDLVKSLVVENTTKIVVLVFDGLGDAPYHEGKTALEVAHIPNLDTLASRSELGQADPVGPGITPGSGPGHLALFGYDPMTMRVGRGVLSALGVDFPLQDGDIAARGNFCTVDPKTGHILDRRAGRIATAECERLTQKIQEQIPRIGEVEILVRPEREHRFLVVFRGPGLVPGITDTDPQKTGVPPLTAQPLVPEARRLAEVVNEFVNRVREVLADETPANMVLLRGFDQRPQIPSLTELYRMRAVGIAAYPMYRGLARLVGMEVREASDKVAQEFAQVQQLWEQYDYFFVHVKETDSAGEDGDFERKVQVLERCDRYLPRLMGLNPDVMVVTGDHSTPALMRSHSWHPVPFLLYSRFTRYDPSQTFTEMNCARGSLGRFPMRYAMSMILANAERLTKFGA